MRIAKDKEWSLQRLKQLAMYLDDEGNPMMDIHVKYLEACRKSVCMQELEKPRQVKLGIYYVYSNLFPKHEVVMQTKQDAKKMK